jgi:hypothetical protein
MMNQSSNIVELLCENNWESRKPATAEELLRLRECFQVDLPEDYEEILRVSNGCSLYGFNTPLIIFSIREVLALLREHDLYESIPQSLIFGADGGGTLYCYDLRSKNNNGSYNVFFVREDEISYEKMIFRSPSLTDTISQIIHGNKIN